MNFFNVKFLNFYCWLSILFTIIRDASMLLEFYFLVQLFWTPFLIMRIQGEIEIERERETNRKRERKCTTTLDTLPLFFYIILHPSRNVAVQRDEKLIWYLFSFTRSIASLFHAFISRKCKVVLIIANPFCA